MEKISSSQNQILTNFNKDKKELSAKEVAFNADLQNAAKGFDAIFIKSMLEQMSSSEGDQLFGKSFANDIYNDMLQGEYAKLMSERQEIGFSKIVVEQYGKKE